MMQGYPLSETLPEDFGLGERFWYWRGASGQSYIHSIYTPDLCPPVAGAVFVIVSNSGGVRTAAAIGRFGADGLWPENTPARQRDDEVHVHLLARGETAAEGVLRDLAAAMDDMPSCRREPEPRRKPVQLELLAA